MLGNIFFTVPPPLGYLGTIFSAIGDINGFAQITLQGVKAQRSVHKFRGTVFWGGFAVELAIVDFAAFEFERQDRQAGAPTVFKPSGAFSNSAFQPE